MREETENESKKLASIEWLKASIQAQRLLEISDYQISAKSAIYRQTSSFEIDSKESVIHVKFALVLYQKFSKILFFIKNSISLAIIPTWNFQDHRPSTYSINILFDPKQIFHQISYKCFVKFGGSSTF